MEGRPTQHRNNTRTSVGNNPHQRLHCIDRDDASDCESDDQTNQVMATIAYLSQRLHTTQTKTKLLLQTQVPFLKRQQVMYNEFDHF